MERFAIIGSALNTKSAAECTCMVLFGANPIQSRMMSSALQCPAKVMAMIRMYRVQVRVSVYGSQHKEELDSKGVRVLYRRQEQEDACVVPHNRRLLVRLQCHNNVQRITSFGWELYLAKYLTKAAKSLTVPMNLSPNATDVERLLKLRSLGRMENGMMLLGIHQCRGSREVVWIPTDPWPKLGRLKRRKHLPEDDTSTDVWYLDRYYFYLELPDGLQLKYPDFYRYYRRTQRNPSEASALASNPAEDMANESLSSDSDDTVDGDRYKADPPDNAKERPYWWPSPPECMERENRDNMGNKWRLRRRTAIPGWNFYLPYGEDAEKYFLQKILLSQPFTKDDHEHRFFSKDNVSKTYMEECILRGLFRGYEEEARETLNNAEARGYSVERLRLLAEVLRAEDIIDATFFNNYMSDLNELDKHRPGDDEPMVADEAEIDPQLAEELKAFMNANDPGAAETLVNALNHWQRMVFEIFVAHFQQQQPKDVLDISTHCRASIAGSRPQLCAILTRVAGYIYLEGTVPVTMQQTHVLRQRRLPYQSTQSGTSSLAIREQYMHIMRASEIVVF